MFLSRLNDICYFFLLINIFAVSQFNNFASSSTSDLIQNSKLNILNQNFSAYAICKLFN